MTTLPPPPEISRLSPSLIRILAGNPSKFTLQGTNTYLLGTGRTRLLIDTGEGRPSWLAALQKVLHSEKATIGHVLLTHRHHDHVGGVEGVKRVVEGVRVWKNQSQDGNVGEGVEEIEDGMAFEVEGARVRAVCTPGHTEDHVVFVWEGEGAVFTGDNVLGHGTSVFEDLGAYVGSLERMRGLFEGEKGKGGSGRAYPGHGPVVEDGLGKVVEYIRHRGQREEQVVQRLKGAVVGEGGVKAEGGQDGGWSVMELVRSIYREVPESLHPAAAGGVVQILQKLLREGKVVEDGEEGDRWRLAGRSAL